jgi:hypothetical protein
VQISTAVRAERSGEFGTSGEGEGHPLGHATRCGARSVTTTTTSTDGDSEGSHRFGRGGAGSRGRIFFISGGGASGTSGGGASSPSGGGPRGTIYDTVYSTTRGSASGSSSSGSSTRGIGFSFTRSSE